MDSLWIVIGVAVGLVLGFVFTFAILRNQVRKAEEDREKWENDRQSFQDRITILTRDAGVLEEKLARIDVYDEAEKKLKDAFDALASGALQTNNQKFLDLAQETLKSYTTLARSDLEKKHVEVDSLIKPIQESLKKLEEQYKDIEVKREGAYSGLSEQVKSLVESQHRLDNNTKSLVQALRSTTQRGRWGEIQLENLVEMAGMVKYCDFQTQETVDTGESKLRPDLIVRMPNHHQIIVDAKAPITGYLEGHECEDENERAAHFLQYSRSVRSHIKALSLKSYWEQFESAEFVVMFLPGEPFMGTALRYDPELIEYSFQNKVILATPTTLLALLKTVAYGWRQEQLAEEAKKIAKEGQNLHKCVTDFLNNYVKIGKALDGAKKAYDAGTYNLNSKVLKSAKRLENLGAKSTKDIPSLDGSDGMIAEISALGEPGDGFSEELLEASSSPDEELTSTLLEDGPSLN